MCWSCINMSLYCTTIIMGLHWLIWQSTLAKSQDLRLSVQSQAMSAIFHPGLQKISEALSVRVTIFYSDWWRWSSTLSNSSLNSYWTRLWPLPPLTYSSNIHSSHSIGWRWALNGPNQAYFWPALDKRPTYLWPGYFLTQPKEILFWPKGKKMKIFTFLREIFQTQTIDGWHDPTWVNKFWSRPITTLGFIIYLSSLTTTTHKLQTQISLDYKHNFLCMHDCGN